MIQGRDYQNYAVSELYKYFETHDEGNPIVAMPTGSGKAVVIALFIQSIFNKCSDQNILMLTHVKELIRQGYDKLITMWPNAPAGIYSSGLNRRDLYRHITYAGIASVYKKAELFKNIDLIIVDECDLVSPAQNTMYLSFINELKKHNPYIRVIGLTATPWRSKHGLLTNEGLFTDICFDMCTIEAFNWLLDEYYLLPLIVPSQVEKIEIPGVSLVGDEYNQKELQAAVDKEEITRKAIQTVISNCGDRASWLVFCSGIEHSIHVKEMLIEMGVSSSIVYSGNKKFPMSGNKRDANIQQFDNQYVRAITNDSVLSVGYDNPKIDLIVELRHSMSSRAFVQRMGRGTRPYYANGFDLNSREGRQNAVEASPKQNCLVFDFPHNTRNLGPINDPIIPPGKGKKKGKGSAPVKICDSCKLIIHASLKECPHCAYEFPEVVKLKTNASTKELIRKKQEEPEIVNFKVDHVTYKKHVKKSTGSISLQIGYFCNVHMFSEYIAFEHAKSRQYTSLWWVRRTSLPQPGTVDDVLKFIDKLKSPKSLDVWINKKHPEIVKQIF